MAQFIIVVSIIILMVMYNQVKIREHKEIISNKITSINGKVIDIKYCIFEKGPFIVRNRRSYIYKFTYSSENGMKEGWVKFGTFNREKWII